VASIAPSDGAGVGQLEPAATNSHGAVAGVAAVAASATRLANRAGGADTAVPSIAAVASCDRAAGINLIDLPRTPDYGDTADAAVTSGTANAIGARAAIAACAARNRADHNVGGGLLHNKPAGHTRWRHSERCRTADEYRQRDDADQRHALCCAGKTSSSQHLRAARKKTR
jgi:hypothetical protein